MAEENANSGQSRLDRMERMLDLLIQDHARFEETHRKLQEQAQAQGEVMGTLIDSQQVLLTAQVVMTETVNRLAISDQKLSDKLDRLTDKVDKLADAQSHTDDRLNSLIAVVDDIVRRPPAQ